MANIIFILIITILVFNFASEQFLQYLNDSYRNKNLPSEALNIYPEEEYIRSQNYEKDKSRFSTLSQSFFFMLILIMLFIQGFAFLDNFIRQFTSNPVLLALLFFGILGFVMDILSTPFNIYSTFFIEENYGFNKTSPKTFILDKIKGWLLSLLIGIPLLAFIVWIFQVGEHLTWIYAWIALAVFSVFFNFFYSTLIVPLFNKQTPLPQGELRNAIQDFAAKVNFGLKNIFLIDGSKRSAKANAYFAGFGAKKRIVLYDTLIEKLTNDELVAVLAHEIGHYKKKHVIKNLIFSLIEMGIMLFLLSVFLKNPLFSQALGAKIHSFHMGALTFGIIYGFIASLLGIVMNIYSRHNEYEADLFVKNNFNPQFLINGLKKLCVNNLSNLNPHPWYVFVNYSHPTLVQRIKALVKTN